MLAKNASVIAIDLYCEKKPKLCGQCGFFGNGQPCRIGYFCSSRSKACSQAVSKTVLYNGGY